MLRSATIGLGLTPGGGSVSRATTQPLTTLPFSGTRTSVPTST